MLGRLSFSAEPAFQRIDQEFSIMSNTLAINGGDPVRDDLLPYGSQSVTGSDADAVREAVLDDWITQGPRIDAFEEAVAGHCDAEHAVAFCNGTAALHAAVAAAGVSDGDEVITSPLTFAATANAVGYEGGTPVFADIDPATLTIDPERVRDRITGATKAVIPVDFAGHPCDYDRIQDLADERDLTVIADACHAPGAEYRGRKTGTLADMTVFSFHPVKHITTGEGGMVVTDDPDIDGFLRRFRHHGVIRNPDEGTRPDEGPWYYEIREPGRNYRITDIQCALGLSQIERLDDFVDTRRQIARTYDQALADLAGIVSPPEHEEVTSSYHLYPIQIREDRFDADRKQFFNAFRAENIGVQVHYVPVHYHPYYRRTFGYEEGDFPETERYYNRAVTLPLFPAMDQNDVDDVLTALHKITAAFRRDR